MKNIATYVELVLSAFLVFVIAILIIKLVGQCFFDIWHDKLELEYYMEYAMSIAIGVEFVKMLCTHQPGTIIEVLLFATARQMIVEHLNVYETLVGIGAIAALFAIRKFLFCSFDEADHMPGQPDSSTRESHNRSQNSGGKDKNSSQYHKRQAE
jgi:hypothetical protein